MKNTVIALVIATIAGCATPGRPPAEYYKCEAIVVRIDGHAVIQNLSACVRV